MGSTFWQDLEERNEDDKYISQLNKFQYSQQLEQKGIFVFRSKIFRGKIKIVCG
jgi:hypothetical protein